MKPTFLRAMCVASLALGLSGCAIEIQHGLDERDANDIYSLLDQHGISVRKTQVAGGKEPTYVISVPKQDASQAIRLLREYSLPRPKLKGYATFSASKGMIPTQTEERAMMLEAYGDEVDSALLKIDGVLDAQTIVAMPEVNDLTQPDKKPLPSASVLVRYRPHPNGEPPLAKTEVAAMVASAVPEMTPDRVTVVLKSAQPLSIDLPPGERLQTVLGITMTHASARDFKLMVAVAGLAMLAMAFFTIWNFLRASPQAAAAKVRR